MAALSKCCCSSIQWFCNSLPSFCQKKNNKIDSVTPYVLENEEFSESNFISLQEPTLCIKKTGEIVFANLAAKNFLANGNMKYQFKNRPVLIFFPKLQGFKNLKEIEAVSLNGTKFPVNVKFNKLSYKQEEVWVQTIEKTDLSAKSFFGLSSEGYPDSIFHPALSRISEEGMDEKE